MVIRMAFFDIDNLRSKYGNFVRPRVLLEVDGKDFDKNKVGLSVSDIEIELSAGYEASIATFVIYNAFDVNNSKFKVEDLKKVIMLGSSISLAVGYANSAVDVFYGFVSKINFTYDGESATPGVQITAMDAKGIMMANNHSRQLKADNYGDAVREIFDEPVYNSMENSGIIKGKIIADTPDKKPGESSDSSSASDKTIEIVGESDYEFIVKAAKKFNYDFFIHLGKIVFRRAKATKDVLMDLAPDSKIIRHLDVEYDISGIVETVEARGMNTADGKVISAKEKASNKISLGNKAKSLIKKSEKVYLDTTIQSDTDAKNRAQSLMEMISYRYGSVECTTMGIPDLLPGYFINLSGVGTAVSNKFYVTTVKHKLDGSGKGFSTTFYGKAASLTDSNAGIGGGMGGLF